MLSSVDELALFSHKGPLNKICPSALDVGRGEFIICEALHSVFINQSLISCCYSHTSLHYSSPKTLGHKILYHSIIPISNGKNKEVKATEATWRPRTGDQDLDVDFKLPSLLLSSLRWQVYIYIHCKGNVFQIIYEEAEQFLFLPGKIRPSGCPHDTFE